MNIENTEDSIRTREYNNSRVFLESLIVNQFSYKVVKMGIDIVVYGKSMSVIIFKTSIRYLNQQRSEVHRLGQNGRRVVEEQFDRRKVLVRFVNHLESLVKAE
jgi:hypothetical protein